jgi:hypothetical protein
MQPIDNMYKIGVRLHIGSTSALAQQGITACVFFAQHLPEIGQNGL